MKTFKDIIHEDVKTAFLNLTEFGELHDINGVQLPAVVDDDLLDGEVSISYHGQSAQRAGGLYSGGIALYISTDDLGKPKVGTMLKLDGKTYTVVSVSEQDGMYKIDLHKTGGR